MYGGESASRAVEGIRADTRGGARYGTVWGWDAVGADSAGMAAAGDWRARRLNKMASTAPQSQPLEGPAHSTQGGAGCLQGTPAPARLRPSAAAAAKASQPAQHTLTRRQALQPLQPAHLPSAPRRHRNPATSCCLLSSLLQPLPCPLPCSRWRGDSWGWLHSPPVPARPAAGASEVAPSPSHRRRHLRPRNSPWH
jgi:hypothetical protein